MRTGHGETRSWTVLGGVAALLLLAGGPAPAAAAATNQVMIGKETSQSWVLWSYSSDDASLAATGKPKILGYYVFAKRSPAIRTELMPREAAIRVHIPGPDALPWGGRDESEWEVPARVPSLNHSYLADRMQLRILDSLRAWQSELVNAGGKEFRVNYLDPRVGPNALTQTTLGALDWNHLAEAARQAFMRPGATDFFVTFFRADGQSFTAADEAVLQKGFALKLTQIQSRAEARAIRYELPPLAEILRRPGEVKTLDQGLDLIRERLLPRFEASAEYQAMRPALAGSRAWKREFLEQAFAQYFRGLGVPSGRKACNPEPVQAIDPLKREGAFERRIYRNDPAELDLELGKEES